MAERITDRTVLTTKPADGDILHVTDISDTTDNAAGTSKQQTVSNLLKGRAFQYILGCMVYKTGSAPSTTTIAAGDFVIWASDSSNSNRMVIGLAKASVTSVPADFDIKATFDKFIDTSSLL